VSFLIHKCFVPYTMCISSGGYIYCYSD